MKIFIFLFIGQFSSAYSQFCKIDFHFPLFFCRDAMLYTTGRLQHVKKDASSAGPPVNNMAEGKHETHTGETQGNLLALLFAICGRVSQWATWPSNFWQHRQGENLFNHARCQCPRASNPGKS